MNCRKYECSPDEYWRDRNQHLSSPINIHIIRYADIILIAAEAEYMLGNNAQALAYINMIRTRARMSGSTSYPVDLSSISLENIMHERRLELALEGHRFFDLVRWGMAEETLNGRYNSTFGVTVEFTEEVDEFFPVPDSIIDLTIPPSGNGTNNINNIHNLTTIIYPNPASSQLFVDLNCFDNVNITIFNIQGKKFIQTKIAKSNQIKIKELPAGVYFIRIDNERINETHRFVKK
ncbi:RagB/SusD family nutrient uptake outer membrane protein [Bacteroidota bacterium]